MGCLWKRQRLSSNHSLLCDCTWGLERKRGWMEGGRDGGRGGMQSRRGAWGGKVWLVLDAAGDLCLELPSGLPCPTGQVAGSMIALYHMMAKTDVLLLKCRQESWGELCMYTNELCCCMLSWWLPSLLDIDPSRVKKREGKRTTKQQQKSMAHYLGITPGSSRSFQRCSLKLRSLLWTLIWITSAYYYIFFVSAGWM